MGYADLHVHTTFSDGRDRPSAVIDRARRLDWLEVIAITDHDEIAGAEEALDYSAGVGGPDVIVGEEVSSVDGHILALFIAERVPPGMTAEATVAAIHDQGGLAIAAHPFWRHRPVRPSYGVGGAIHELPFDAVEVINGGFTPSMVRANQRAAQAVAGRAISRVGGSDAHVREAVGWARTAFPGATAADLRWALFAEMTTAEVGPIALTGITRYAAWSLGRVRPQAAVS